MEPVAVAVRGYDVQNTDGNAGYRSYWAEDPKPLEIWGLNDTLEDKKVILKYSLMTVKGEILRDKQDTVCIVANSAQMLEKVRLDDLDFIPEQTILYTSISDEGKIISENRYFFAPFAKMPVEAAKVKCSVKKTSESTYDIDLSSDSFVWMVHMETPDGTDVSDNDFDLIPDMPRKITVTTKDQDFVPVFHWIGTGETCIS